MCAAHETRALAGSASVSIGVRDGFVAHVGVRGGA